jgi:hypothetical protein
MNYIIISSFQDWLTCQYPHSSASKHITSDLVLFFSWAGKPPSEKSPQDADGFIERNPYTVRWFLNTKLGQRLTNTSRRVKTHHTFPFIITPCPSAPLKNTTSCSLPSSPLSPTDCCSPSQAFTGTTGPSHGSRTSSVPPNSTPPSRRSARSLARSSTSPRA